MHAAVAALTLAAGLAAQAADTIPLGRLPRTVVPSHIALQLRIDPAQPRFSGTVAMDVEVAQATRTIWMHGRDLAITLAAITPQGGSRQQLAATVEDVSGVLKFSAPQSIPAGPARIEIDYEAPFGQTQGAYRVKPQGIDYVLTQMEPNGARFAFPAFDEPAFKQPWDVSLVIPSGLVGVANTRLVREEPAGDGWKKIVFATTEKLPAYLVAFAVGPWDVVDGPALAPNAVRQRPVALRGITARGQGARMKYALENTGAIVAAEEEYFGIPYPYDKLDILAAPDFRAGAMENAGLIVYRDSILFADAQSSVREIRRYWNVHAHELAHQWFGDLVTMPWWDDLWLNEAFATWFANKMVGQLRPGFHSDRELMESALHAMDKDSLASTRRVREPIRAFTDIQSAFDGITYSKGAALLAMFERHVGEVPMRDAIRGYLRQHAHGHATSADLVGAIAAASSDPERVREAFSRFIDQPGVPLVSARTDCAGPQPVVHVLQQRFLPSGSIASAGEGWVLPLCLRWADSTGTHAQCTLVDGKESAVALPASSCPAWVMPNANGAGYYRFALAPADQVRLESNLDGLSEREQMAFADSAIAAFASGTQDAGDFLRAAARLALVPEQRAALAPVARIEWMIRHVARTEGQKRQLRATVSRLYAPRLAQLGLVPRGGEDDETRVLRSGLLSALAEVAKDAGVRDRLADMGRSVLGLGGAGRKERGSKGDGMLHADAVPADLRGLALHMAMQQGDSTVFDALLRHLAASQDPELRVQLISAASDAQRAGQRARLRALALAPGGLRRNEIQWLLPKERDEPAALRAARDWVDTNFNALERRLGPSAGELVHTYATNMCSTQESDALLKKFSRRMRDIEGGPRAVLQAVETVRLCAALAARQTGTLPGP